MSAEIYGKNGSQDWEINVELQELLGQAANKGLTVQSISSLIYKFNA